jgi:hypothetical protein
LAALLATWISSRINVIWPRKTSFPAEIGTSPGFSLDFQVPLSIMGMEVVGDPNFPTEISWYRFSMSASKGLRGREKVVLAALLEFVKVHDPDVILFPYADSDVHTTMRYLHIADATKREKYEKCLILLS